MFAANEQTKTKALILSGLPVNAISPAVESIIRESVESKADMHNHAQIMRSAAEYIMAYLDLGFSYLEHKELFDHVLSAVGYTKSALDALAKRNKEISCSKTRLGSLLGRWSNSAHKSHTKAQAIEEIMNLVDTMAVGEYQFYSSRKEGSYSAMFVLQISEDCAVLHDVLNNKFYRLTK